MLSPKKIPRYDSLGRVLNEYALGIINVCIIKLKIYEIIPEIWSNKRMSLLHSLRRYPFMSTGLKFWGL